MINIGQLQDVFEKHPHLEKTISLLDSSRSIGIRGLKGSSKSMFLAGVYHANRTPIVCILNEFEEAGYFYSDLCRILGKESVLFFPSSSKGNRQSKKVDYGNEILRTEVLSYLQNPNPPKIIVTYPEAVSEKIISNETLLKNTIDIKVGEQVDQSFVIDMLDSFKFQYVDYVYEPGQYAHRGSILDVFSFSNELPYRIDFFGDEVHTLRTFDVDTQLSNTRKDSISIVAEVELEKNKTETIFSLLPSDSVVACDDYPWLLSYVEKRFRNSVNGEESIDLKNEDAEEDGMKHSGFPITLASQSEIKNSFSKFRSLHFRIVGEIETDAVVEFDTSLQPLFQKNFELIAESFKNYIRDGYEIYILSDSKAQQIRLKNIFSDRQDQIDFISVDKTLHSGFSDNTLKICCFTDHQIFNRYHKYTLASEKSRKGKISITLKELKQFQPGDYIVHIDHGIGQFAGLVRLNISGKTQEFVKLTYLNNDSVFVSIHALHKISKYKGKEGAPPKLNKIGSGAWERVKERTKSKIKDIARDLIRLYAARNQEKGIAFPHDSYMQTELEASFLYEDTPDQIKATEDVKRDMESSKPMDRLICGDVGFGKTEIAIRAAFKAVSDDKQVAVLVPTTVLAAQHFRTFSDRLADFPCRVDYLSRARSPKEQKAILADLKEGKIDILIATHRLIRSDVQFKDLGLLIIDEEQKFGVAVKEKLRQMRVNVDTLTMTATPIPRTLQFSLLGARDLSIISTPPPNRYPIQTEVVQFGAEIVKSAIEYELGRNGQVFFVHNRVQDIYQIADFIRRSVPDARVVVVHGQLPPKETEKSILDFVNQDYDILVATSIIESGIDISNVNTILINNAQNFGLSDLHQLRGRVGRGNRKSFCYLLTPPLNLINSDARRRLQAIETLSDLGSGFSVAMQDLDIRGAGNMLGAEQSGFIADLGYETYQKILSEAVSELKHDEFSSLFEDEDKNRSDEVLKVQEVQIETDMELMFPLTYIPNDSERIAIYRELDSLETDEQIATFITHLEDRFGKLPRQGRDLIRIIKLRGLARSLGFEKINLYKERMIVYLPNDENSPFYKSKSFDKLLGYVQKNPKRCNFRDDNNKKSISFGSVQTVDQSIEILSTILSME